MERSAHAASAPQAIRSEGLPHRPGVRVFTIDLSQEEEAALTSDASEIGALKSGAEAPVLAQKAA